MEAIIYLTRHGLSAHNLRTEVFMGRSPESHLVAEGRQQALLLGARFSREGLSLDKIVASSLPRTMETARLIAEAVGIDTVEGEDAFWELSKGDWEGLMPRLNLPEAVAQALKADPFGFRYPGGESYRDVTKRVAAAFDSHVAAHAGRALLFVLHGDVLRAVLHHTLRFPEDKIGDFILEPCSLSELRWRDGRYHLARFNDGTHLAALESHSP